MSAKKRKHLGSLLDESVFGTKEAPLPPTRPEVVYQPPAPALAPASPPIASLNWKHYQHPDTSNTVRFIVSPHSTRVGSLCTLNPFPFNPKRLA
jgi:hypothetical protein